jgi:hypothetical protein
MTTDDRDDTQRDEQREDAVDEQRDDAVDEEAARRRVPRTTTTGDPEQDVRQPDAGADSDLRAHGRRGPYHHVDSDDHAWDPPGET